MRRLLLSLVVVSCTACAAGSVGQPGWDDGEDQVDGTPAPSDGDAHVAPAPSDTAVGDAPEATDSAPSEQDPVEPDSPGPPVGPLPVLPGLVGYGADTVAGRNGTVMRVTNVNDSGAGSLRACVLAKVPRVCVFEVSGTINLTSRLEIHDPYITIAGQTAPAPGILIRGDGLLVWSTHDVLVQHLQIRPGDDPNVGTVCSQRGGFIVWSDAHASSYNIVVDHLSTGWATDQSMSTWGENETASIHDITFSNSIFSEALNDACHDKGAHPMGPLLGMATSRVTMVDNILAQQKYRNPLMNTGMTDGIIVNNLIYHPGTTGSGKIDLELDVEGYPGPFRYAIAGNAMIGRDGDSGGKVIWVIPDGPTSAQIYAKDNSFNGVSKDWDSVGSYGTVNGAMRASTPPVWNTGITARPASAVEAYVIAHAGARPAHRDAIDSRMIANINARTGEDIDSPDDVGGYPFYATVTRAFVTPANPAADDDGDGYTNLEEILQRMAADVEGR